MKLKVFWVSCHYIVVTRKYEASYVKVTLLFCKDYVIYVPQRIFILRFNHVRDNT